MTATSGRCPEGSARAPVAWTPSRRCQAKATAPPCPAIGLLGCEGSPSLSSARFSRSLSAASLLARLSTLASKLSQSFRRAATCPPRSISARTAAAGRVADARPEHVREDRPERRRRMVRASVRIPTQPPTGAESAARSSSRSSSAIASASSARTAAGSPARTPEARSAPAAGRRVESSASAIASSARRRRSRSILDLATASRFPLAQRRRETSSPTPPATAASARSGRASFRAAATGAAAHRERHRLPARVGKTRTSSEASTRPIR